MATDTRIEFIEGYVLGSLKLKADKFAKMINVEENTAALNDFLDKKDLSLLVIYFDAKDQLAVSHDWPRALKKKAVYFIKPEAEMAITKDNVSSLVRGDLSYSPAEQVSALVEGVVLPILSNKSNSSGWPQVVAHDIISQAQALKSTAAVTTGSIRGETVLPVPAGAEAALGEDGENAKPNSTDPTAIDLQQRAIVHAVETSVISWSAQVRAVLGRDSAQPLMEGLHPTPLFELDFWNSRFTSLNAIYDQLTGPQISKLRAILEEHKSTYAPALASLTDDVKAALDEADDVTLHLEPCRQYFEGLEEAEMERLPTVFRQIMHVLSLVWKNSQHYNLPRRIVVVLRECMNQIISNLLTFLDPPTLFKSEVGEALAKVRESRKMLADIATAFDEGRASLNSSLTDAGTDVGTDMQQGGPWLFATDLVFGRVETFSARLDLISEILESAADYTKLEKVELSKEKLSMQVAAIFEEFNEAWTALGVATGDASEGGHNAMDPLDPAFLSTHRGFMDLLEDWDRRLAAIACHAFDQTNSLEGMFKLMNGFQGLLERPRLDEEVRDRYPQMMALFDEDLGIVKRLYNEQVVHNSVPVNMPETAGCLKASQQLRSRIQSLYDQFQFYHTIAAFRDGEAERVYAKYNEMLELLGSYDKSVYEAWAADVGAKSDVNLNRPLLCRDAETHLISVNFDPQLVAVLREVRYLESLQRDDSSADADAAGASPTSQIPESATAIYSRNETFRQYLANLDIAVTEYNRIQSTLLDVEAPLVQAQLQHIDTVLESAITTLNWNSPNVSEYCLSTKDLIVDLSNRIQQAKSNVEEILDTMGKWFDSPFLTRDAKTGLLIYADKDKNMASSRAAITTGGERFHELLGKNLELFKTTADSPDWRAYVTYIDETVLDGLYNAIHTSVSYILDHADATATAHPDGSPVRPFMEGSFQLVPPTTIFEPGMSDQDPAPTLLTQATTLLDDFFSCGTLIPRLAKHIDKPDYHSDLSSNSELVLLRTELQMKVESVTTAAMAFQQSLLNTYQHLWVDDRHEFMREFLRYGHKLTPEELEQANEAPLPATPPTNAQFKENIDKYNQIAEGVLKLDDTVVFDQWFRVDLRPFKSKLHNTVLKWSYMFVEHLTNHVTNSLTELDAFIKSTNTGLNTPITDLDYDQLVTVMGFLNNVNARIEHTDAIFTPLNETVALLKTYDVEMPQTVHNYLTTLPEKWADTKKLADNVGHEVAPVQADEVAKLKRKCNQFDVRNFEFREDFIKRAPLFYNAENVYARINQHYREYMDMEAEMDQLAEAASILNVKLPEYKQLKSCRRELAHLKHLWDLIFLVRAEFDQWKLTLWKEVNVETMEMECKRFIKETRQLDKETRAWEAFNGIDADVKNMMTSLSAVGLLQSPAIRDRHWQQVMNATGVKIQMSDSTTLKNLLELNLHKFEDEVAGIVDRATKEQGMEKMLGELETTWSAFEFEYDLHKRTETPLLKASEELIEVLEDNQVQLQNLMSSKYIAHFLEEVSSWQRKLSNTDQVLEIWMDVQRTWSHLESIFIGSEDIRAQLPDDSKRFDGIDVDFKQVMKEAKETPNVVAATNKEGLFDALEDMQNRLALCEKALQEYLETKRLAFPRFYFVSSADLLDILSNGNQPRMVAKQLAKLFQMMCNLKFKDDTSKEAIGMYALDGEYVDFTEPIICDGRVEDWLMKLLVNMQTTIRTVMGESVVTYEEKPRSEWVFDYPAQIALVGTQIWWATEVNIAFGRLEEGYETAMKEYNKKQVNHLNDLITLLQGKLTKAQRVMLQTICTVDVHSRDVVINLINQKAESAESFIWLSQLRHAWDEKAGECRISICDARFTYSYEYLGNVPRLVITPLTDRCYITLTQSLHLIMSGAPAGPAGTGKTETTKDLGRNIGIMVYVFNCSEQMDYKSVGNIFKGLAQTGAWGCFDEFNRISIEVLSVVAVQVKTIQDAIRAKKRRFNFLGEEIGMIPTVGIFITMNPGYAGRTELPENIKALFRPCAMVVPDYGQICEIMLVSEGFLNAKLLARKFITLYTLNRDLLSKQDHYDWGLRAIKSVLVVAGALKRADPDRSEDEVLMRALRDFNIPKIVNDDLPVFMGLIGDLFPGLQVPRKRDVEFEKTIRQAIGELKLQAEDSFVLKVVQLQELLDVRHSVFVLGGAATGKSCVLKSLFKTYQLQKRKPVWADMNPKAVTNHELYGYINLATREWVDGLFSSVMRDISNMPNEAPKWLVMDGDIDTMWIESLNTVMDDNKVLTLASNERISLKPDMRLLFEIANLTYASPATVSRAGILFVNPTDLGWNPFVTSWIETLESPGQRANLMILFEKYVPPCLEVLKLRFKPITPVPEWAMINTLCHLVELLMTPTNTPEGCSKEDYELYFCWAAVWAFGGALFKDQLVDYRDEFTKWWVTEFKTVKFPSQGTVFDYFIRPEDKKFVPWQEMVPGFQYDPELPLQAALVPTSETTRIRFWMDLLMDAGHPVLLVGAPGTGKTAMIWDRLTTLSEDWVVANTAFNNYTTHHMIQSVLEAPLEKKAGRNYGPPGTKRLVYFVDDLNMPQVDLYGTASPHTVMRQHLDYNHWYDRQKHTLKIVSNTQYVASMNPKAGSFTINPRLLRHFTTFAISAPGDAALKTIYQSLFDGHLTTNSFVSAISKISEKVVDAAIKLHNKVSTTFLPTAIKFHYLFNLRDLSNIFQGIHFSRNDLIKTPLQVVRLWLHEATRVYSDKLTDEQDLNTFADMRNGVAKEFFGDVEEDKMLEQPNIHCHFAGGIGEPKYQSIKDFKGLHETLSEALNSYNEVNAAMNLVLFQDAMQHVCRINRILESPRGNALLVGVGGSGKQSLSRLAASISGLDTFQIALSKGYGINELKADLGQCFVKTGQKGQGVMFLMTDAQVAEEKFLVLINDLLASGNIPGLFADDERQDIIDGVRGEVKGQGIEDTNVNCWNFFLDRVRRTLKVVLCFSPVGDTLRVRARKFPALVNCTQIDWFHEWPEEALISVSKSFLEENELIPAEIKPSISQFMASVHASVNDMSAVYLANERRYNYTTPKSFLEQIKLYQNLLSIKGGELQENMDRMENGLTKLKSTAAQVDDLKEKLAVQEVELAEKNREADVLIEKVGVETEKVNKEKAVASVEQEKVRVLNEEVGAKQRSCEEDLAKAEPALAAAQEALNTLNKNNLTELKSFGSPPNIVITVAAAVMCLLAQGGRVPKDRSWKAAKGMMGNVTSFLDNLLNYDKENIPAENLKAVKEYLKDPEFNPDFVRGKSLAAAGLCAWAINIVSFYEVYCDVEPKRIALAEANAQLDAANTKLNKIMDKIRKLDEALARLTAEFQAATDAKLKCQQEADATSKTINLANRLVGGLASEKVRWGEAVDKFREQEKTLPGDVLLVSAFMSYAGCFSKQYRTMLYDDKWLTCLKSLDVPIPTTEDLDPLSLLTDNSKIARWQNEGLPADRVSVENATILTSTKRWPLIIDPQEQGIKWIKQREGEELRVIRLGQKGYLDFIERAVSNGDCMLIENLGEEVDPVLDNLLGQVTVKKGRAVMIGDKEVEYNPQFRLILHTKMGNPHYKPEMQAQCTLINFTVTQLGLEDQLLADVVSAERSDLQESKAALTKEQNQYMITLKELEDNLLAKLSSAEGDFLKDEALVEGLETTKKTANEIEIKVKEAKETEAAINTARENYRPAAARAALLYFIIDELVKIHPMYQVSLKAFNVVFARAIRVAEKDEDVAVRVKNIIETITFNVYVYTTRGLFEKDKLIFASQMVIRIMQMRGEVVQQELDFLLKLPSVPNSTSPVDFLGNAAWGSVKALSAFEALNGLDKDIEGSAKRWKKFCEAGAPEKEKLPGEWKNKTPVQRLCVLRCLRPDRMLYAMRAFVGEVVGEKYTAGRAVEFSKSYEETTRATGVFFILSAGVNPVNQVEEHGKKLGFTFDNGNYVQVSLGQGQEIVAEQALDKASKEGGWVVLENIHLVVKWLPTLEKKLEECSLEAHENFRYFLTAEPAGTPEAHIMPAGILQACIKITNEPPTGMQSNLHAALDEFDQSTLEMCPREVEFRRIFFSLIYFHAIVIERRKFGPQGWNRNYPFNKGDLTISVAVLNNYLESNSGAVPWTDLRYLFAEIFYGGHITDNLDRRLAVTYCYTYINASMLDGDLELAPGFLLPPPSDYQEYHDYVDNTLPEESPLLYGLHPNAEVAFLLTTSTRLFSIVLEMQPRQTGGVQGEGGQTREEQLNGIIDDIMEKLPETFNELDMASRCPPEERTPYTVVVFQETQRMNKLLNELSRSLKELRLGLKGELTITPQMEALSASLFANTVPANWEDKAYPSVKPLGLWYSDLIERCKNLDAWQSDFNLPAVVWLGGLFNPQSLLTAVQQQTARKQELPLDKMTLQVEVTKKMNREDFPSAPREGTYLCGLFLEGARWDMQSGQIQESRMKELAPPMPVVYVKAVTVEKLQAETSKGGSYCSPVFKTKERGRAREQVAVGVCPGFVADFWLKTKVNPNIWTLAGVAVLLSD